MAAVREEGSGDGGLRRRILPTQTPRRCPPTYSLLRGCTPSPSRSTLASSPLREALRRYQGYQVEIAKIDSSGHSILPNVSHATLNAYFHLMQGTYRVSEFKLESAIVPVQVTPFCGILCWQVATMILISLAYYRNLHCVASCKMRSSVTARRTRMTLLPQKSHPALTMEERTMLCRCLNYEKLTLEACKDLAKNRRIPPGIAVQALASQQFKLQIKPGGAAKCGRADPSQTPRRVAGGGGGGARSRSVSVDLGAMDEKELLKLNLQKMQSRVVELERVCKEMRGQMSKMAKGKSFGATSCHQTGDRGLPRLC